MLLERLELHNHRNYAHLVLEPGPGVNVFLGANGQGKTNLLEAVAMLALSASPRARRDVELIGPVAAESRIHARVDSARRTVEIGISVRMEEERPRRTIEVDGIRRRSFDLPGHFRVALFWPDDLGLVKAGPELRRRYLNQMLVQIEPGYARSLTRLGRVFEQRNSLLRRIRNGEAGRDELDVWDAELVEVAAPIIAARAAAVRDLQPEARRAHAAVAAGERLDIAYVGPPDDLAGALRDTREEDIRRGTTGVGPHRDDLAIRLEAEEARGFASQGQQRTAVVSLKLAEAEVIHQRTSERPVLLLDDVLSELDSSRRRALLELVEQGGQVIVTAVEADSFPASLLAGSKVWTVSSGRIENCG